MNMEEMISDHKKLHIVMFPWLAFGHMMPFLELAKCLATKGHHISFVSTPRNLQRLPKVPQHLSTFISFVPLPLPRLESLPDDAEATRDVGYEKGYDLLKKAYDGLQEPMSKFLGSSVSSPHHPIDWIIYDFSCYWLPPIADKLGIRKVYFSVFIARLLAITGPISQDIDTNPGAVGLWSSPEILTSPPHWIPFPNSTVYLPPYEARPFFQAVTQKTTSGVSDLFRLQTCIKGSDFVAVRGCMELEGEYLQLVEKLDLKTVVPVGLLPPSVENFGDEHDDEWNLIIRWLEKQRKGSVVYVAFGSEFVPNQEQLIELALGLELSTIPFFLVFRTPGVASSVKLPDGFEERTRDRGMIQTSWVPQVRILSHDSVGGSLTHAGISSMVESLMLGKPVVMLPLGADQGINARFMAEKKVGIEIPRNKEDGSFTRSSVAESLALVLQDEAGKTYRDHAKEISAIFADKSLQNQYIDKFCSHLYDYKSSV